MRNGQGAHRPPGSIALIPSRWTASQGAEAQTAPDHPRPEYCFDLKRTKDCESSNHPSPVLPSPCSWRVVHLRGTGRDGAQHLAPSVSFLTAFLGSVSSPISVSFLCLLLEKANSLAGGAHFHPFLPHAEPSCHYLPSLFLISFCFSLL